MTSAITTINYPNKTIEILSKRLMTFVIGDVKTPKDWSHENALFYGVEEKHDFNIMQFLPKNHYCRKNIGYLLAMASGTHFIYDTDDDNIPNDNWKQRTVEVEASESVGTGWYNVYDLISDKTIWPRGFSLHHLGVYPSCGMNKKFNSSIQQGLSDGESDVDAVWRLIFKKQNYFDRHKSIYLKPGAWCPFNSQSTWWFPKAYPLMYLPVCASFRMTDIWRSFVAQRCLWEMGEGVTFHSPSEVFQDRNKHDLLKDFEDEIPGYLHNDEIVQILTDLTLNYDVCGNLIECYRALVKEGILPMEEVRSVRNWIKDIEKIWKP